MELANKTTILIALAIVVILAIGTGMIIKKSMDAKPNNEITVDLASTNNPTTVAAMSQVTDQNITPAITAHVDDHNNTQMTTNSSQLVTSTASPDVTASPSAIISPAPIISPTAMVNPPDSPLYNISKYQYLQADGMYTVTVYVLNNESEGVQLYNEFVSDVVPKSFTSASNVTVLLLLEAVGSRTYRPVDMPGNPLTSSNCLIWDEPSYTFTNVSASESWRPDIWVEYNGKVYRDMAMFGTDHVAGFNINLNQGDVIPGSVSSGTIYGYVDDQITEKDTGVNISLYSCVPGSSAGSYVNTGLVNVSGNPQLSGSTGDNGLFRFDGLQPGLYNVTAEKNGQTGYYIVDLKQNWNGLAADPSDGKYILVGIS